MFYIISHFINYYTIDYYTIIRIAIINYQNKIQIKEIFLLKIKK